MSGSQEQTGRAVVCMPHRGIGDLMWHLPFIREIAAASPGGTVDLITRQSTFAHELLAPEPTVNQIVYLPYLQGFQKQQREMLAATRLFRRLRPDSVWILDKISRLAMAARLAGVRHRLGFGYGQQAIWLSRKTGLPKTTKALHQIKQLEAFFVSLGMPVPDTEPKLRIDPALVHEFRSRFGSHRKPWIAVGLQASTAERNWPPAYYETLIATLQSEGIGTVFIAGGPGEAQAADSLAERFPDCVVPLAEAGFSKFCGLMGNADLFIGPDSGPLNVAAAAAVPTLGLFGPTPVLTHSRYIHGLTPERISTDMSEIQPATVFGRAKTILEESGAQPG